MSTIFSFSRLYPLHLCVCVCVWVGERGTQREAKLRVFHPEGRLPWRVTRYMWNQKDLLKDLCIGL